MSMPDARRIVILQMSQAEEMGEFVEKEKARLMVDLRNAVRAERITEAAAVEHVMSYVEQLPGRLKAFASK